MSWARLAITWLCAYAALAACDQAPPPTPAASPSPAAAAPSDSAIVVKSRIHADLPEMRFTLQGDAATPIEGVLRVHAIEIRRDGVPDLLQRIEGFATHTPWSTEAPGFEVLDMNFDGYADIRLIESRPAGPDVPYLNWLYNPAIGLFVESPALNQITSPRFDAAAREVRSDWRDGAARYGTDIHVYRDGQLVPVRRETREMLRPDVQRLRMWRWVNGSWQVESTREIKSR